MRGSSECSGSAHPPTMHATRRTQTARRTVVAQWMDGDAGDQMQRGCAVEAEDFSGPSVLAVWLVRMRSAVGQSSSSNPDLATRSFFASLRWLSVALPLPERARVRRGEGQVVLLLLSTSVSIHPFIHPSGTRPTHPSNQPTNQPCPQTGPSHLFAR